MLRARFRELDLPEIHVGIGINTGVMSVGNMGSEFRMAYTVLGDAVNLTSRLQNLTRQYHVDLIVGEATMQAVPEMVYRELDRVRVRGRNTPVPVYEPLGPAASLEPSRQEELAAYDAALSLYRERDWAGAERAFRALHDRYPGAGLYLLYASRCADYHANPPPADWDGVFTVLRK
jgi:adenylate cyclase